MLTLDLQSNSPLVEQIVSGLRYAVACGRLAPGDHLPSIRQLAADLGIHFNTVARAYRALEADGLVRSTRGRGTRVSASTARDGTVGGAQEALRYALANTRLSGYTRQQVEALIRSELDEIWPTKETSE